MRHSSRSPIIIALLFVTGGALACSSPAPEDNDPLILRTAVDMLSVPYQDIDILFVVDNSGSMGDEYDALANWAEEYLFGVLELESGQLPNLHIGVISTDLGANDGLAGCAGNGDDGILQSEPQFVGCTGPTDSFISDVALPDGTRDRNYTGELGETFACIAMLGNLGCGFEQPLAAAVRGLTHPDNSGFLRPNALLAVVFVTDEDDCSADRSMFDPSQNDINSELGPVSSFRCFEHGVTCDQSDPRTPGARTGCYASSSVYMEDVGTYADELKALKPHPSMVMVAGIIGDPEPVSVRLDSFSNNPQLEPSCSGTVNGGEALPAIRLSGFLRDFPGRYQEVSICEDQLAGPLQAIASFVGNVAKRSPCLRGDIADNDAASPGIQPECQVREVIGAGTDEHIETMLRECGAGETPDAECYVIEADPQECSDTATQLVVRVPDRESQFVVDCR